MAPDIVGVALLAMAALFNLMDGMQVVALGLLRGVQDTGVPMILAAIRLPVGATLGFALGWGAIGVWLGLVVGLTSAAALLMRRYWGRSARLGL